MTEPDSSQPRQVQDRYWDLFVELRKEIIESQKIRSQILGFKITFVSAFLGVLLGIQSVDPFTGIIFAIPAFAAVFFDFVIESYSFSIHRIGRYTREVIEETLIQRGAFTEDFPPWQKWLAKDTVTPRKKYMVYFGNMGFDIIVASGAVYALLHPYRPVLSETLIVILVALLGRVTYMHLTHHQGDDAV